MIKEIEELIKKFKGNVSLYACDELNNEIRINENIVVETASAIKLFILIEYYKQIMNNEKSRDDILSYKFSEDFVENGSGIIQFLDSGLNITSKNMAILMIIISDNIATNKMIDYLGFENINNTIKELGLKNTKLIAKKIDFNQYLQIGVTTAYEYANTYKMLLNSSILTPNLCNEIIDILSKQMYNQMIIKELPLKYIDSKGKTDSFIKYIASKSGGLGGENAKTVICRNDGGIISTKSGNYITSVFINNFSDYYFYDNNPATILGAKINKILFENFEKNKGSFVK